MPFQVGGTKKGGMPVTTEKRPRGKTATVIANVRGDKDELLRMLQSSLGCGGRAVAHDRVEIQGDHAAAIQGLLLRHGGASSMRGIAGLKPKPPPATAPPEDDRDAHPSSSRRARDETPPSESSVAAARARRKRAIATAVLAKPESTRSFHAYAAMMKRWRYWDQDYSRLHEMHHRHLRDLDDAASAPALAGGDDDEETDGDRFQREPRSAVLDAMRRDLDALDPAASARHRAAPHDVRAALDALGMIARASPHAQTRDARLAEHRKNRAAAAADDDAGPAGASRSSATFGSTFGGASASTRARGAPAWDPALAALRAYGDGDEGAGRGRRGIGGIGGGIGGIGAGSRVRPFAAAAAAAAGPRGRRHAGMGEVAKSTVSRKPPRGRGRPGGHGKGDASRPTLGFTAARKRGGGARGGGAFGAFGDDGWSYSDDESSDAEFDEPVANPRSSFEVGWRANPGGGFSFGPVVGAEDARPNPRRVPAEAASRDPPSPAGPDPGRTMDREEAELREALRRSLLVEEPARRDAAPRRAGLHVECEDVWGDLTEEEALALAMALSEQEEARNRAARDEAEAEERRFLYGGDGDAFAEPGARDAFRRRAFAGESESSGGASFPEEAGGGGEGDARRDARAYSEHRPRDDEEEEEEEEEDAALAEALRLSAAEAARVRREDAAAEEEAAALAEALRLSAAEAEAEAEARRGAVVRDAFDEDAALAEALRLSALEAEARAEGGGGGVGEGAVASTLSWCGDALARFTGEADNAVLAEYVVAMESAEEARVFLEESFGDAEAAAAFAAELEKVARGEG